MKDIRSVSENTTKKMELLEGQLKECTKFLTAIDNYVSDTHVKIDAIRGMFLQSDAFLIYMSFLSYVCYYKLS